MWVLHILASMCLKGQVPQVNLFSVRKIPTKGHVFQKSRNPRGTFLDLSGYPSIYICPKDKCPRTPTFQL